MSASDAYGDPRRRDQRHRTDAVTCDLGEVIDLAVGGARLVCKGRPPLAPGTVGKLRLRGPNGAILIQARAAWIRRCGFRRYEVGLQFLDLTNTTIAAIDSLARYGFFAKTDAARTSRRSRAAGKSPRDPGARIGGKAGDGALYAKFDLPDYYTVLGIAPDASEEAIQQAYRALARKYHPDVCRAPDAQQRFIEISRAYEVLRDPDQRRRFDRRAVA